MHVPINVKSPNNISKWQMGFNSAFKWLRKKFGPVNIDNVWRIRNNMEIGNLIEGADIVRFIKAQRIRWPGHIQIMDQARPTRKLLDWKPMGTRAVGRPRQR
jgi:hypothetical protein